MQLCTTSETISFSRELEEKTAKYYQEVAGKFPEGKDLLSFAEENRKYIIQIQRAYQSVITDAIEGCFAFQLESEDYLIHTDLPAQTTFKEALQQALTVEETMVSFYTTAAEQSMALMADIPRNFKIVAKKRAVRIEKLRALG